MTYVSSKLAPAYEIFTLAKVVARLRVSWPTLGSGPLQKAYIVKIKL